MRYLVGILVAIGIVFVFSPRSSVSPQPSFDYFRSYNYEAGEGDYEEPLTSENWDCTEDCSGHEAGYNWAADQGITDPEECGGNSNSFIEGCEAYANEYQMENEYEEEDEYGYPY